MRACLHEDTYMCATAAGDSSENVSPISQQIAKTHPETKVNFHQWLQEHQTSVCFSINSKAM